MMFIAFDHIEHKNHFVPLGQGIDQHLNMLYIHIRGNRIGFDLISFIYFIVKDYKLLLSDIGNTFMYHNPANPTLETTLEPECSQVFKYLKKTTDHYVFRKMQILNILPTNPKHFWREFPINMFLRFRIPCSRFFYELFFVIVDCNDLQNDLIGFYKDRRKTREDSCLRIGKKF